MKYIIRYIICIILFIILCFFGYRYWEIIGNNVQELTISNEVVSITGAKYSFITKYIYIVNEENSTVQIFSKGGDFIKGINIPLNGGSVYASCDAENKVHLYCVRTGVLIEINGLDYSALLNVRYNDVEEFLLATNSLVTKYNIGNLSRNKMKYVDVLYGEKEVFLKAPTNLLTRDGYLIGYVGTLILVLYLTGWLEKMFKNSVEKVDKEFSRYRKRLKK